MIPPSERYILNAQGELVPEPDFKRWVTWCEEAWRDGTMILAQETRTINDVEVMVSTIFLGMNHQLLLGGPPLLWETMVFWLGHMCDRAMERYTSRAEAKTGHANWVALIFREEQAESLEEFSIRVDQLLAEVRARSDVEAP